MDYPQKNVSETVKINFTITENSSGASASNSVVEIRTVPNAYVNMWAAGSFGLPASSLKYHFNKHGSSLGINNIYSYAVTADNFRKGFSSSSPRTSVAGVTSNTWRYKSGSTYIDVSGDDPKCGLIVSFR